MAFRAPDDPFNGATGPVYVAYRGTGDGKWVDNGVGMYEISQMQQLAGDYFDYDSAA